MALSDADLQKLQDAIAAAYQGFLAPYCEDGPPPSEATLRAFVQHARDNTVFAFALGKICDLFMELAAQGLLTLENLDQIVGPGSARKALGKKLILFRSPD